MPDSPSRRWVLSFAWASGLAAFYLVHAYMYSNFFGEPIAWRPLTLWTLSEWYSWALLAPFVFQLGRKFSFEGKTLGKAVLTNIGTWAFFSSIHVFAQALFRYVAELQQRPFSRGLTWGEVHYSLATCGIMLGAIQAVEYYRRYRDRKLRASQLEAALAQAKLDALRMQIQPHFLFNALNSVSALMDEDKKAAQTMLARLGDFLRLTLKSTGSQVSTLEQEMQFLTSYLQIEQVRFDDRLKVHVQVEPDAMRALVPSLILQPIVENAFRHAISKVDAGNLDIRARREGDMLELSVTDNGPGIAAGAESRAQGLGLTNTRARLQTQYGDNQSLRLENVTGGGLRVTIRIPFDGGPA